MYGYIFGQHPVTSCNSVLEHVLIGTGIEMVSSFDDNVN